MDKELDALLKIIRNRKAAGLDEMPPEVWNARKFDDIFLWLYNTVYKQNTTENWTKGCILPFPKEGELGITENFKRILLLILPLRLIILRKKSERLSKKSLNLFTDSDYPSIDRRSTNKESRDNMMIERFLQIQTSQAEFLIHSLDQEAGRRIILYVNSNKTEIICFKQEAISSQK